MIYKLPLFAVSPSYHKCFFSHTLQTALLHSTQLNVSAPGPSAGGAPAAAHLPKFDCCPLCFSRVILAMELPALLLPLSTRDSDNGTKPKPAAGACVERDVTTLDPEVSTQKCCWNVNMSCVWLLPSPVTWTNNGAFGRRLCIDYKYSRWCNFLEVPKFLFWTQKGHTASATDSSTCEKPSFQCKTPWIH